MSDTHQPFADDGLSSCGCHACGGLEARDLAVVARRARRLLPVLAAARHEDSTRLAQRVVEPEVGWRLAEVWRIALHSHGLPVGPVAADQFYRRAVAAFARR